MLLCARYSLAILELWESQEGVSKVFMHVIQFDCGDFVQNLSTIPIPPGKQGLALKHDGVTENMRSYTLHKMDCAARSEASWRAKLACNGPTSSVGVTLGGWTQK